MSAVPIDLGTEVALPIVQATPRIGVQDREKIARQALVIGLLMAVAAQQRKLCLLRQAAVAIRGRT